MSGICSLSVLALVLLGSSAIAEGHSHTARVVVEHWPPWEVAHDTEKEKVSSGVAIKLIDEIMRRMGLPVLYVTVPWKRALKELRQGKSDIIPMVARNAERERYMLFTSAIYEDPMLLAYSVDKLEHFEWSGWQDLEGYTFQLVRGYTYGKAWDNAVKKHNFQVSMSTSDEQSVQMLAGGRIDLIPLFFVAGTQILAENNLSEKIRFALKPIRKTILHFGISKKSFLSGRMSEINRHIRNMKKEGFFDKALEEGNIRTKQPGATFKVHGGSGMP